MVYYEQIEVVGRGNSQYMPLHQNPELSSLLSQIEEGALIALETPDRTSSDAVYAGWLREDIRVDIHNNVTESRRGGTVKTRSFTSMGLHVAKELIGDVAFLEDSTQAERSNVVEVLLPKNRTLIPVLDEYRRGNEIAAALAVYEDIINGTLAGKWPDVEKPDKFKGIIALLPVDGYLVDLPPELKDQFLTNSRKAIARQGLLYFDSERRWKFNNQDYLLVQSHLTPNEKYSTGEGPLSLQLRVGDISYCLDKIGDSFDQKTFTGPTSTWYRDINHQKAETTTDNSVAAFIKMDPNRIIEREAYERSLGMYEPTLGVAKSIYNALKKAMGT